jgi:membrane-associated HD superfamily phosphohydrolase
MKKIILDKEKTEEIIKLYVDNKLGSPSISKKIGIHKNVIIRILKENGVNIGNSGRKFIGGKKVADKKYREKNKKRLDEYTKNWYEENKEHRKQYLKEYREKNIDKIREVKRTYEKHRKDTDPIYKLISNFRTAIYQVLKESNVEKNGHYFEILGYTPEELINHLEKQFKDGMTWDNYGDFHIDHIIPISSFNIQEIGDEEFMKCWSLSNLQPMWGEENIRKSNKIILP